MGHNIERLNPVSGESMEFFTVVFVVSQKSANHLHYPVDVPEVILAGQKLFP